MEFIYSNEHVANMLENQNNLLIFLFNNDQIYWSGQSKSITITLTLKQP